MTQTNMVIIGRAEKADFTELGFLSIPVKIDTGADYSSIWAHVAEKEGGILKVVFFGPESPYFTGEEVTFSQDKYEITRVSNSFGQKEIRYKVKLQITIADRTIRATFTLADRSKKLYPVLIGRALLSKKFIVDVSKGSPLKAEEEKRKQNLQEELLNIGEVSV